MHRMEMDDDPLGFVLRLVEREDPRMWQNIQNVIAIDDHVKTAMEQIKRSAAEDIRSRVVTT